MIRLISMLICLLLMGHCFAQLKKIKEIKLSGITNVSVDRLGNFYFVTGDGRIHKYDPNAKLLATSAPNSGPLSLIEAWNPLRVFTYYAGDSTYHIFNYNLELLEIKKVDPSHAITPALACPGNEPTLWILDEADLSLKKVNYRTNELILESKIDSASNQTRFEFMRSYQDYLFISDSNGNIRILNRLGKPVTIVPSVRGHYFNFLGEEICFRRGGELLLLDLYTAELRSVTKLAEPEMIAFSIISDERVILGRKDRVEFYTYHLPQN